VLIFERIREELRRFLQGVLFHENPESATQLGEYKYNNQLSDYSRNKSSGRTGFAM
jgi:hypothetical protein